MRHLTLSLLLLGLLFGASASTNAQTYDLSWHTIAGGGGTSTSSVYTVTGTIGQSAAGTLSGGAYTVTGGFWGIIAAVQVQGSPFLTIMTTNNNHVVIGWNAASTGFTLQQNSAIGDINWVNVNTNTFPVVVTAGTNTITLPVSGGNQFFRLSNKP